MKKQSNYYDMIHRCGVIWDIGALLVLLCVPAAFCLYLDVGPNLKALGSAMLKLIPLYWPVALIEIFTYVPMLGAGATYLSFVTGNIPNLKLPCGLNAMESAGVRPNSDEGEVISTIAVGVSSITTTVIIAVGVIAFSPVLPLITADGSAFKPAFEQVLPALFGALGASYFVKHWRLAFAPIITGVVVLVFVPTLPAGTLMFVTIVASVLGAVIIYRKDFAPMLKKKAN